MPKRKQFGLYKPHENWTWRYDFRIRGKRYRGSTRTHDYNLAEQFTTKLYSDIYLDRHEIKKIVEETKIDDFVTRHVLALQADCSPHWTYSSERTLREFADYLKEQGIVNLSGINIEVLEMYKRFQLNCVKKITVMNKLKVVKAMLNRAFKYGIIKDNPVGKLSPVKGIPKNKIRFFSEDELNKITKAFDDPQFQRFHYMKDFVNMALYTGTRRKELTNLEWNDIDVDMGCIHIRNKDGFTTKSYKERIVPIHPSLLPFLSQRKAGLIFLHLGKKFNDKTTTKNFSILLERLGIEGAGIHTLRHTFASHLIMAGVNMRTVAEYLGHSTIVITELYSHLSPEYVKNEIKKLQYFEKKPVLENGNQYTGAICQKSDKDQIDTRIQVLEEALCT